MPKGQFAHSTEIGFYRRVVLYEQNWNLVHLFKGQHKRLARDGEGDATAIEPYANEVGRLADDLKRKLNKGSCVIRS